MFRKSFLLSFLLLLFCFNSSIYAQQPAKAQSPVYEVKSSQHKIDSSLEEDKALSEMLAPYEANVKKQMATVIGNAPTTINKEGAAAGRLGMLMTEIIRSQASLALKKHIDLSFQNNGGIRAEIPAGNITIGTIYRLMPFDNQVIVIELLGKDLLQLFEDMGTNIKDYGSAVGGAKLLYKDKKLISAKINDKDIDPNTTYTLALTDYLYQGGGEYPILRKGKNAQLCGLLLRDAIINHIKAEQAENRPIAVNGESPISFQEDK
jgi:2',3'-cyclic-nucleotide 2'-phosphodiesterase (5'-nucleotidase family)